MRIREITDINKTGAIISADRPDQTFLDLNIDMLVGDRYENAKIILRNLVINRNVWEYEQWSTVARFALQDSEKILETLEKLKSSIHRAQWDLADPDFNSKLDMIKGRSRELRKRIKSVQDLM